MEKGKRLLMVDDDADFVATARTLLEANGYEVFTAASGSAGLDMAREVRPDLMILDVMMATQDEGFEVSRKLRDVPGLEKVPVIMVTGIRSAMDLPFRFGPDDTWLPVRAVLDKPVAPERLLEEVRKQLAAGPE